MNKAISNNYPLISNDKLTIQLRQESIDTWYKLMDYVQNLPYGRNVNRNDLSLVWQEKKGTCSSKHAFLKKIADINQLPNIDLIIGVYKMNGENTAGVAKILERYELDYIPEAHCYLNIDGKRVDLTHQSADFGQIKDDILVEQSIRPKQVAAYKVQYHQSFLRQWLTENAIAFDFKKLWKIREECIDALSQFS